MDKQDKPCMGCMEESQGQERGEAGKGQPGEVSPPRETAPPTGVQPRPSPAGGEKGPGQTICRKQEGLIDRGRPVYGEEKCSIR